MSLRLTRCAIIALTILAFIPSEAPGQGSGVVVSQWIVPDARAQGMGRAFTAVGEGAWVGWWNPGLIALQRGLFIGPYSRSKLAPDFGNGYWIKHLSMAGSWHRLGFSIQRTRLEMGEYSDEQGIELKPAWESVTIVGCGFDASSMLFSAPSLHRAGIGANLKLMHNVSGTAGGFGPTATDERTWDLDVGVATVLRQNMELLGLPRIDGHLEKVG